MLSLPDTRRGGLEKQAQKRRLRFSDVTAYTRPWPMKPCKKILVEAVLRNAAEKS